MDILSNYILSSSAQFISASQPITALAYIFDGLHYGVSDFPFAACSMVSHFFRSNVRIVLLFSRQTVHHLLLMAYKFIPDDSWGNFFSVSAVCSFNNRSFRSMVGFDSIHGVAFCGWVYEVTLTCIEIVIYKL